MDREQAVKYLQSSGFSEEQIKAIEGAFTCDKCVYSTSEGCQYDDITETIPPFEDCISRKEAISIAGIATLFVNQVVAALKKLPPVNPQEPKTGYWIDDEFGRRCSCCNIYTHLDKFDRPMKFRHCSMCGAKMQEVKE